MTTTTVRTPLFPLAVATAFVLSACASPAPDTNAEEDTARAAQNTSLAELVTVADPWVKAVDADDGMTAAFGVLANGGEEEAVIVAAHAEEVADTVELHEVVAGDDGNTVMQEKDGGFAVPPAGEHELSPGADHIMFMGLTRDLEPGAEVIVTLEFDDGSTHEFTAPVKDFEGANENYDEGH